MAQEPVIDDKNHYSTNDSILSIQQIDSYEALDFAPLKFSPFILEENKEKV